MISPIDLFLISGFLGSGKTTLLRSLIKNLSDKKIAVLVNEFGTIGVDGKLIENDDIQLVEINNGSIFCACLKDGFARTMKAFARQPIDVLLIENSGMADPSSMNKLLASLSPYLDRPYNYRGAICLVDCSTVDDYLDVLAPMQNQIRSAGFIIMNKTDLAEKNALAEIKASIKELNQLAYIYETSFAKIPFSLLKDQLIKHHYDGSSSNTPHNRPTSCSLEANGYYDEEQIKKFWGLLGGSILRMKGFMRSENCWLHVDAVIGGDISVTKLSDSQASSLSGNSRLIIISYEGNNIKSLIKQCWQESGLGPYTTIQCG